MMIWEKIRQVIGEKDGFRTSYERKDLFVLKNEDPNSISQTARFKIRYSWRNSDGQIMKRMKLFWSEEEALRLFDDLSIRGSIREGL